MQDPPARPYRRCTAVRVVRVRQTGRILDFVGTGGYKTPPRDFFPIESRFGFHPCRVVNRLIGDFFWGLRQVPAPPPGLNGGVWGGPLPLKMWILPGQGQGSKLKSRSDGQMINFNRGYLVVEK